jgi:hypothetical protein
LNSSDQKLLHQREGTPCGIEQTSNFLGAHSLQQPTWTHAYESDHLVVTSEMTRKQACFLGILSCLALGPVFALGLNDLTSQDASLGIKGALTEGATSAIAKLGVPGGFLNNSEVKIPLPPALNQLAKGMRMMGRGKDADDLVATMNQAAEQAVPQAKALMLNAVKTMSVEDAKGILTGGDDSVTRFF